MTRILIAAPVRQEERVFREYLASLDRLRIPGDCQCERAFYLHCSPELRRLLRPEDTVLINDGGAEFQAGDYTHRWSGEALSAVAGMKTELARLAVDRGFDYLFLVDSDLILHPDTLEVLLSRKKHIISEIFWTRWRPEDEPMPNCWDYDFYSFGDGGKRYRRSGVMETGGTGACILISTEVFRLAAGVTGWEPVPSLPMTAWEDRAFAVRAQCAGFRLWVDTTRPARHLYRTEDYEKYIEKKRKAGLP